MPLNLRAYIKEELKQRLLFLSLFVKSSVPKLLSTFLRCLDDQVDTPSKCLYIYIDSCIVKDRSIKKKEEERRNSSKSHLR